MDDSGPDDDGRAGQLISGDRLDSWKEISAYLGRGVRTIQRWEGREGLPVHRHVHAAKGSVYALRSELDAWRTSRSDVVSEPPEADKTDSERPAGAPVPARRRSVVVALAILMAVGGLTIVALKAGQGAAVRARREAPVVRPLAVEAECESHPSLSPDGREVVYQRYSPTAALVIRSTAGGPARQLTPVAAGREDAFPAWSPRGDAIAFLRQNAWQPARRELLLISPRNGSERRLTDAGGIGLSWTPDGRSLAFIDSESAGEPHAIFLVSPETGRRRRLTHPALGSFGDLYCAFSPDGRSLAFSRWPTTVSGDVWIMPSEGGAARQITSGLMVQEGLDWTPDGRSIVFSARESGQLGLWEVRVTPDGSAAPTPIPGTAGGVFPSFSRPQRGRRASLAFESARSDVNVWRWKGSLGGGTFDGVVSSTYYDSDPALSPGGDRLLFTSDRTGHNEIWTANGDGKNATRVTYRDGPIVLAPRFSPDGQHIAFVSAVGENRDVFVADADGSSSRRLTSEPSEEGLPSWSHDGRWVYFRSDRGGVPQIWKVPSAGGAAVRVTRGEGWQAFEAPGGERVYFVRSRDLHGIWSVPVSGGPETLVLPDVREGLWAVADTGIVFAARGADRWSIERFDTASRKTSRVAILPSEREVKPGFDVSPDGRTAVWTQVDTSSHDIMLIDPWVD